jgi:hypothetical protein
VVPLVVLLLADVKTDMSGQIYSFLWQRSYKSMATASYSTPVTAAVAVLLGFSLVVQFLVPSIIITVEVKQVIQLQRFAIRSSKADS